MNKIKLLIMILLYMLFMPSVSAEGVDDNCNPKDGCILVCNYNNQFQYSSGSDTNNTTKEISIYYNAGLWQVKWENLNADNTIEKSKTSSDFIKVFENSKVRIPSEISKEISSENFVCPQNGYIDNHISSGGNEVCFDNDSSWCRSQKGTIIVDQVAFANSKDGNYLFKSASKTYDIFDIDSILDNFILCDDVLEGKYSDDSEISIRKNVPAFIVNYLEKNNVSLGDALEKRLDFCGKRATTEEQKENVENVNTEELMGELENFFAGIENEGEIYNKMDCEGLLGNPEDSNALAYWIQWMLNIIKYIAIIALLILSTMDFIKAIVSGDKDALKKASITTIKRFLFAVLIFFLPIIVEVIMKLFGAYGTCNIG